MTEQTKELVTKVDVQPDLAGLIAFEREIDRAINQVNKLDTAIKHVGELRPASRYSPPVNNPRATVAAAGLSAGLGANLVNRGALAPLVRKASQDVAKNAAQTAATGVNLAIEDMRGRMVSGRIGSAGGGIIPHSGVNWSGGGTGGLARAGDFTQNPFNRFNFEGAAWGDKAAKTTKTKTSSGAGGKGDDLSMPDMMVGAAAAVGLSMGLDAVAQSMDRIQSKQAQLARLPQTLTDSKTAFLELNEAATQVRSGGDAFISTYTNMATATEKLGLSQAETIKATQGMVSALQLGGGGKAAIDAATYQMGQAFSSNRFGGDEFKSFMEAIGTMAPEVAKAFGTDQAGLRKMSEDGKLTAEIMTKAFAKMADKNIDLLNKQGWTWGQVTTVMKNDWDIFLASATGGGEWARLMSWVHQNLVPGFRTAEQAVAKFWTTTTDESKASILVGILGAIGAAFAALAIPVLAATWPFLAIGAAVFLLYELFQEFKHWMDGSAKTIFDNLFGSFDEFEKRYPLIVDGLKKLTAASSASTGSVKGAESEGEQKKTVWNQLANPYNLFGNTMDFLEQRGNNFNPLTGVEKFLGWFSDDAKSPTAATGLTPPAVQSGSQTTISNTNSGNTTITVATPEDAATVANNRDKSFVNQAGSGLDNMAEGGGYL